MLIEKKWDVLLIDTINIVKMSRILKTLYYIRDRVTFWAIKTNNEQYDEEQESEAEEEIDLDLSEEGRGMRTERILRAIIRIPVRWFQLNYHARRLERSLNKEHPECPVRIKVVDRLVGTPFIENTFDIGLIVIPCLFLFSFILWAMSRFYARTILEMASLVAVIISIIAFLIFGLIFVFAAFFGYEFEYDNGQKQSRRKRNPPDSYHKFA